MSNYSELKKHILSLIFTDFINNVNKDVTENKISISAVADNIAYELSLNIHALKFLTDNNFCSPADIIKEKQLKAIRVRKTVRVKMSDLEEYLSAYDEAV